jgi:hypothetical protein
MLTRWAERILGVAGKTRTELWDGSVLYGDPANLRPWREPRPYQAYIWVDGRKVPIVPAGHGNTTWEQLGAFPYVSGRDPDGDGIGKGA